MPEIDVAASELGYPVYDLGRYAVFHTQAMPLLEQKIAALLSDNEKNHPEYAIMGRDLDTFYDALATVTAGTEIAGRVHLINLGRAHADQVEMFPQHSLGYQIYIKEYLGENSVSAESLKSSNFVFLDSCYYGTMFDFMLQMGETSRADMGDRLKGYLLLRGESDDIEESPYQELGWPTSYKPDIQFYNKFYESFAKLWDGDHDWTPNSMLPRLDNARKVNFALAHLMQVEPKFTQPGFRIDHIRGKWRSVPALEDQGYPIPIVDPIEFPDVNSPIWHPNSCPVDPVASLKLQKMTVDYFSQSHVKESVLQNVT